MYVCVCRAVTENDVHDCIAGGATSAKQVRDTTGPAATAPLVCGRSVQS